MKRSLCAAVLALAACRDVGADLARCFDAGRCSEGMTGGGGGGAVGGGGGGGGTAGGAGGAGGGALAFPGLGIFTRRYHFDEQFSAPNGPPTTSVIEPFTRIGAWVEEGAAFNHYLALPAQCVGTEAGAVLAGWTIDGGGPADGGVFNQTGCYRLPTLPDGGWLLAFELPVGQPVPVLLLTGTARNVDFSNERLGRAGIAAAGPGTVIAIDAGGVAAWAAGDDLDVYSLGGGLAGTGFKEMFGVEPAVGATGLQADLDWEGQPLLGGEDRLVVFQTGLSTSDGGLEFADVKAVGLAMVALQDGLTTPLGIVLAPPTTAKLPYVFAPTLDVVEMERVGLDAIAFVPGAILRRVERFGAMGAAPNGGRGGFGAAFFSFVTLTHPDGGMVGPTADGGVSFARQISTPFPLTWEAFFTHQVVATVDVPTAFQKADGGPAFAQNFAGTWWFALAGTLALDAGAPPMAPKLERLAQANLDNFPLAGAAIRRTPRLQLNSTPAPTLYEVLVTRVIPDLTVARGLRTQSVALLLLGPTAQPRFPPGLLEAGNTYFLRVRAVYSTARDFAGAPRLRRLPEWNTQTLTSTFSVTDAG